jgi:hypothetical protein
MIMKNESLPPNTGMLLVIEVSLKLSKVPGIQSVVGIGRWRREANTAARVVSGRLPSTSFVTCNRREQEIISYVWGRSPT